MAQLDYPDMTLPDGDKRYRSLEVRETGELVFETADVGPGTAKLAPNGGDRDYEYWVTVAPDNVQRVLLELIRDRFASEREFRDWLDSMKIPSSFESY